MLTRFVDVEISEPLQPIYLDPRYHRLGLVGCWHGRPLGTTFLDPARGERNFSAEQVRTAVLRYFGMLLWEQLACGALEGTTSSDGAPLPPVSVIVCTRDRPLSLESCLRALAELDYPSYEVLVIDNCSRGDEVVRVVR
ncbi:MAG: glycosyltransferase family 2 protein, partial [Acidobacteria bacterium]|nr:glycosyltransferase family 2 protein [Acidobacteriota bacterium]